MNANERIEVKELKTRLDTIEYNLIKKDKKLDKILFLLEDDDRSEAKGLISKVIKIQDNVLELELFKRRQTRVWNAIKGIAIALLTTMGGVYVKNNYNG
jgi:hypothetical protein